jgi:hypothetical protein
MQPLPPRHQGGLTDTEIRRICWPNTATLLPHICLRTEAPEVDLERAPSPLRREAAATITAVRRHDRGKVSKHQRYRGASRALEKPSPALKPIVQAQ